jgi:hypothetical protein
MTPRHVLGLLLAFTLLVGLIDAHEVAHNGAHDADAAWWGVVSTLLFSFLCFYWYRLDGERRRFRRSRWLNVGIVMLAIVAVPYYLARSRPMGEKGRALLGLAGFVVLLGGTAVLGGALSTLFG